MKSRSASHLHPFWVIFPDHISGSLVVKRLQRGLVAVYIEGKNVTFSHYNVQCICMDSHSELFPPQHFCGTVLIGTAVIRKKLNSLDLNETILTYIKKKTQIKQEFKHLESSKKNIEQQILI